MLGWVRSCEMYKGMNQQSLVQTRYLTELQNPLSTLLLQPNTINTKFEFRFHNL
jgi:hypothetical protein